MNHRCYLRGQIPISWKMPSKMIIACLLNFKKYQKLGTNRFKPDWKLLPKIFFRSNNIHREIDQWNRHRFGPKWNVTVPNSVTPVKPIVCKWIYMSRVMLLNDTQFAHIFKVHPYCRETVILSILYKIHDEKYSFLLFSTTRIKHIIWKQHISVNVHIAQILIKKLSWRNGIRY